MYGDRYMLYVVGSGWCNLMCVDCRLLLIVVFVWNLSFDFVSYGCW